MNKTTPHAMHYGIYPFSECGKEISATIVVSMKHIDTHGKMSDEEMVTEMRQRMAEVMDCPIERINVFSR